MVEAAFVLLVFLVTVIGIMDFGQVLYVHQTLTERVRGALRWGIAQPWDGSGDKIANMVIYNQPTAPIALDDIPILPESPAPTSAFLGLTRANVQVTYTPPPADDPNDERVTVSIINYNFRFFSPWIARTFTSNNAIVQSSALLYK